MAVSKRGSGWIFNEVPQTQTNKSSKSRARKAKALRALTEALEERQLMTVLPAPVLPAPTSIQHGYVTGPTADTNSAHTTPAASSPSIAYNPLNPMELVSAEVINDPGGAANGQTVFVSLSFSSNGGATWTSLGNFANLDDPVNSQPNAAPIRYAQATDPTVAFDRLGNFYLSYLEHAPGTGSNSGAIVLQKFSWTGNTPTQTISDQVVYTWAGRDAAVTPTMAVNSNVRTFTDPTTGTTVTDQTIDATTGQGPIYIAWATDDANRPSPASLSNFNPDVIRMVASSDGGVTFTAPQFVDTGNTNPRTATVPLHTTGSSISDAHPKITISQGDPAGKIQPGQVNVVWDNFNAGRSGTTDEIMYNSLQAGWSAGGSGDLTNPNIVDGGTTDIPIDVTSVGAGLFSVQNVTLQLALTHASLGELSISLKSPDGTTVSLVGAGSLTGANMGIATSGLVAGTTFDDGSLYTLTLPGVSAPYLGSYQPQGNLQNFDGKEPSGTWHLIIGDSSADATTAQIVSVANLNLTLSDNATGLSLKEKTPSVVATTQNLKGALGDSYPLGSPASPFQGIGPAPVIASDNTLGDLSPYAGRLYVAYVDRAPSGSLNDTNDTDIKLAFFNGSSWTNAGIVNDDNGRTDGFTGAQGVGFGRPQFQPAIAVDPNTGTLGMTWYDARNDSSIAHVATYFATSIDGGADFGPQTYLNRPNEVFDAISGTAVDLGPIPDTMAAGQIDPTFGFGNQMGLTMIGGQVHAVWAGNEDGGPVGHQLMDVLSANTTIANGPRIISSTMGVVGEATDLVNPLTANGPALQYIDVTFDRPVDIASFIASAVHVQYRGTSTNGALSGSPDIPLDATNPITPLDPKLYGEAQTILSATTFRIKLAVPQYQIGTYTYSIDPVVSDGIRHYGLTNYSNELTFTTAQNQQNISVPTPGNSSGSSSVIVTGLTGTDQIVDVNVDANIIGTGDPNSVLSVFLIGPNGVKIPLSLNRFGPTEPSSISVALLTDPSAGGNGFIGTTWDDQASMPDAFGRFEFSGSFRPEDDPNVVGAGSDLTLAAFNGMLGGVANGTWKLQVVNSLPNNGVNHTATITNWTLRLRTASVYTDDTQPALTGNTMDQNSDARSGNASNSKNVGDVYAVPTPTASNSFVSTGFYTPNYDSTTVPITVPGPHVITFPEYDSGAVNLPLNDATVNGGVTTSTIAVSGDPNALVKQVMVSVNLSYTNTKDLLLTLIAPDGTPITLVNHRPATANNSIINFGNDLMPVVFSDQASDPISGNTAFETFTNGGATSQQYVGYYQSEVPLSLLEGKNINGNWKLSVTNTATGTTGTLKDWSLHISSNIVATNTSVSSINVTFDRPMDASSFTPSKVLQILGPAGPISLTGITITPINDRTFTIGFPAQNVSGAYTITLAPTITSSDSRPLDTNLNAGVDMLLDSSTSTTVKNYTSAPGTVQIPSATSTANGVQRSTITVPASDNFNIKGVRVTLNLTDFHDNKLSAVLIAPDGSSVELFSHLTSTGANFTNAIFSDTASLPIQNGSAPFNGTFNPQQPLMETLLNKLSAGTWTLLVTSSDANAGSIGSWSLSFDKPVPNSGVGETSSDQASVNFTVMNVGNALSTQNWTPLITGSAQDNANTGRVSAIAVDPSDPSGNTVYIGGAAGGVWKTTNFLTTDPAGPHWVPLTDFGPSSALSIGGIAVFAKNNDVHQSVIFAATGEGNTSTSGVGFIRSTDGGATWTLLDSTNNNSGAAHDHLFNSLVTDKTFTSYKIVVDPNPTSDGNEIVYAAISGDDSVAGIWRSLDSGMTWTRMKAGQATDIVLDLNSAVFNSVSNPTKNVQALYAAFSPAIVNGVVSGGVYRSPNRGQVWNQMSGGIGDPNFRQGDVAGAPTVPVGDLPVTPIPNGRIVLAMPALTGDPIQDVLYQGWLYAADVSLDAANPNDPTNGRLVGLYMTKDFGQNWVQVQLPDRTSPTSGLPTNDLSRNDYDPTGGAAVPAGEGNFAISLAVDPNNPNVVYLGGTRDGTGVSGLIRVDTTGISDAHSLYMDVNGLATGDRWQTIENTVLRGSWQADGGAVLVNPIDDPTINLLQDPNRPFVQGTQIFFGDVASITASGANVKWIPFDLQPEESAMTDYHTLVTIKDPITGQTRLIAGTGQGIFSVVENGSGAIVTNQLDPQSQKASANSLIGNTLNNFSAAGARNGDLAIMQVVYGAVQPSNLAAQAAGAMFYVSTQGNGLGSSSADILTSGNTTWTFSPVPGGNGGVATDQTGSGTHYDTANPFENGVGQDFFEVNGTGRVFGLIQSTSSTGNTTLDAQWPDQVGPNIYWAPNFTVNSLNGDQIVISSNAGRLFGTENQGRFWSVIADPSNLDSSYVPALAYGAPDPTGPGGPSVTDFLIYAGTNNGNVFVTFHGGGVTNNDWQNIGSFDAISNLVTIGSGSTGTFTLGTNIGGVAVTTAALADTATAADISAALDAIPQIAALGGATVTNAVSASGTAFTILLPPLASALTGTVTPDSSGGSASLTIVTTTMPQAIAGIVTDPTPGSHDLYVVTKGDPFNGIKPGVYFLADSKAAAAGTPQWQNVTGNLLSLQNRTGSNFTTALGSDMAVTDLTSIQADWRYRIANDSLNPSAGTHPLLYVGGTGGVYTSSDNGTTWNFFGGNLPNVKVTDLDLSLGNIDPVTGNPVVSTGPAVMMASTDGRGAFSIRVAPTTAGNRLAAVSDNGSSNTDGITNELVPSISGYSAATIAGSDTVKVTLLDGNGKIIGGFDPSDPSTDVAANYTDANGFFQIPVKPGTFTASGTYTVYVEATDDTGFTGSPQPSTSFQIDITPPVAPATPDLMDASDSGASDTDNITSVTTPKFQGANGSVEPFATVNLYNDNNPLSPVLIGTAQADANGAWTITVSSALADGVYAITATQTDVAGNVGPMSTALSVTIDTTAPAAPSVPDLTDASDSGPVTPNVAPYNSDNYTNVTLPTFQGTSEANATINLYDVTDPLNPILLGTGQTDGSGNWTVTSTVLLTDGDHQIAAQQTDQAGNTGVMSAALTITIDTIQPVNPSSPDLVSSSDSGRSNTDNVTNIKTPTFTGVVEPFAFVEILNSNDSKNPIVIGSGFADSQGNYSITVSISNALADGSYSISARQTDLAGNVSTFGFGRPGSIVIDGTDANQHGYRDSSVTPNVNADGWFYMQSVLQNIRPNVGNGNKVLVALDAGRPSPGTFGGLGDGNNTAGEAIDSAFDLSDLPANGWTIVHVDGTANVDAYLAGQTVTGADLTGNPVTISIAGTGILHIPTVDNATMDMPDTDLQVLINHASDIRNYVNNGGGLFAMSESPFDASVPAYGWLTAILPGITVTNVGTGGDRGEAIQISPEGQIAFPGLTAADLSVDHWHDYFDGNFGSLITLASDLDTPITGTRRTIVLTPGLTAQPLNLVVDTTPPSVPTIAMSSTSDTGASNSDGITQSNEPSFGGTAEPNSIVSIYNGFDPSTRVLLATVTTAGNGVWAWTPSSPFVDGAYTLVVTATDVAGNTADPAVTPDPINPNQGILHIAIDNTAPAIQTYTIPETEGQAFTATLGAFTDANPIPSTATIDWGDGSPSEAGTIAANTTGGYDVRGSHTYSLYGTYTTTITVTDAAGNTSTLTGIANVSDPSMIATGNFNITGNEGSSTGSQVVATFTDPGIVHPASAYIATITWGDGSSSTGTISFNNGTFSVAGAHTYSEQGSFSVLVTIHNGAATDVTVGSTATISDPAVSLSGGRTITAVAGATSSLQTVAVFTDPGGPEAVADYAPLIDWGDGSALDTTGTISVNGLTGVFAVKGSHLYKTPGNYTVTVVVNHEKAPASSTTSNATVSDSPLSVVNVPLTAQEGELLSTKIAVLTDSNIYSQASQYSVSINWGDGSAPSAGTVLADPNVVGQFNIIGTHVYADGPSAYNMTFTVTSQYGSHINGGQRVNVVNVAPTPVISGPVTRFQGNITFGVSVTDPSSADRAAGFTYSVDWGDGSPATVISATANNFNTQTLNHVFASDANYTVTVSVTDKDGATGSTTISSLGPQSVNLDPVENLVINNGSPSRNAINSLDFTLFTPTAPIASLSTSDLILLHNGSEVISLQNAQVSFDPATGAFHLNTSNLSLPDGQYQLQISRGAAGVIPVNFSKLTGDVNGDGIVNKTDLALIKANFGSSNSAYDLNGDGVVDKNDYNLVKKLNGRRTAAITNRIVVTPTKGLSKPAIKFGNLKLGQAVAPVDLVLTNNDPTQALRIQDLKINGNDGVYDVEIVGGAWGQKPSEFLIPAGQTVTVRVFINPIRTGKHNAALSFIFSRNDHSLFNFADLPISAKVS